VTVHHETRATSGTQTKSDKRRAGRTTAADTPLELRGLDGTQDIQLRSWVHERMGRELTKFATHIERAQVRFGDENGPKGGVDQVCLIHLTLSKLPPVVVEARGETERQAFDKAAGRSDRALRHTLERHNFHAHTAHRDKHEGHERIANMQQSGDGLDTADESIFGRHVGHGADQLMLLQERPEKVRRDLQVDTSAAGVSATDRKVGYGHTGARNTKLNTEGMAYKLEDSTTDRPSRKSTRGGTNHVKSDANLTLRTKSAIQSPKQRALRSH